ncbi:cAMP-regulated D2 protein-like [Ptychodera flava]|uniref:cAMP-regulated D2 protein-like n=1 Tax=Ptychodera flava TaxID=63121 RepID=UPI00396A13B1
MYITTEVQIVRLIVTTAIFACLVRAFQTSQSSSPVVNTKNGKVEGLYLEEARVFYGVPYAQPPTGANRWKSPQAVQTWSPKVLQAKTPPPGCPQQCMNPPHVCPNKTNENCLFLNFFTPLDATSSSKLPVMVYIHGGNFRDGVGANDLQDGRYLANHTNTIVGSINYRVGALGFLVAGKGAEAARGNYGIEDQRMAFAWFKENIAAFGGDPDRITMFGQSAGAQSVGIHLTSEKSADVFDQAIVESNPLTLPFKTRIESVILGDYLATELNCSRGDITCLRSKDANDIVAAQQTVSSKIVNPFRLMELFEPWGPHLDDDNLKQQPVDAMARGDFQKKPIMIGTTSDEARVNLFMAYKTPMDKTQYYETIVADFPTHFIKILGKYPALTSGDQREILDFAGTAYIFLCPNRKVERGIARVQDNVWVYLFDHVLSFDAWGPQFAFCRNHSCHGAELPFVFHSAPLAGFHYTVDEEELSQSMIYYWTNFAHTGNPNNPPSSNTGAVRRRFIEWPQYNASESQYIHFKTPKTTINSNYRGNECDFWDSLNVYP